jgi:hypothetical protein
MPCLSIKSRWSSATNSRTFLFLWLIISFNENEWDLRDTSQRPREIHYKFTDKQKQIVVNVRRQIGFSSQKLRISLKNRDIFMSESTIKRIIKCHGLSNGNKMEGIKKGRAR